MAKTLPMQWQASGRNECCCIDPGQAGSMQASNQPPLSAGMNGATWWPPSQIIFSAT